MYNKVYQVIEAKKKSLNERVGYLSADIISLIGPPLPDQLKSRQPPNIILKPASQQITPMCPKNILINQNDVATENWKTRFPCHVFTLFRFEFSASPSGLFLFLSPLSSSRKLGPLPATGVWKFRGLGSMLLSPPALPKPHSG